MWIFNVFLYLVFLQGQYVGDMRGYQEWVDAGAPCYEAVGAPQESQPVCWYDPSNTNSGN